MQKFFNGKTLNRSVNPDEAVAFGAAVQAAILNGSTHEATSDLLLLDVSPLSLGIETMGGQMAVVIPRSTTIPVKQSQVFSTAADNQSSVTIKVYEGERTLTRDNHLLGNFDLHGIPPAPRGVPQIEVTFDMDANGILQVRAEDKSTGKKSAITITNDKGRLTKEEIDRMVNDAEKYKKEDEAIAARISAKNTLENYCYSLRNTIQEQEFAKKLSADEKSSFENVVNETITWLDSNPEASTEEFEEKKKAVEAVVNPIISKGYQGGACPMPGDMPTGAGSGSTGSGSKGPQVEEVD